MTEPYLDHTDELLQNPRQVISKPWRGTWKRLAFALLLTVLCGFMLTGCQEFWDTASDLLRIDGGDAEAQGTRDEDRIETHVIEPGSFRIRVNSNSDNSPDINVQSEATEFTMRSSGEVFFNVVSDGTPDRDVQSGDIIILRPSGSTATVTIIRVLTN